jgi:hypothetical protein
MHVIANVLKYDGDLIRKQVELINPELVICGGVWRFVSHLWPEAQEVYDRIWRDNNQTFIDFCHPGNRAFGPLKYYALAFLLERSSLRRRAARS